MRLYLVQHGDAVPERLGPERPLSAAGRQEVEAVARLLAGGGARVAHVVHSGKLRAQQTAELLATALAAGRVPEVIAGLSPNDPVEPMVRRIADWTSDVVLVGHLPFMGKLVARLVAGDEGKPVAAFVPGTVVCLKREEANHWTVVWMVRPALASAGGAGMNPPLEPGPPAISVVIKTACAAAPPSWPAVAAPAAQA